MLNVIYLMHNPTSLSKLGTVGVTDKAWSMTKAELPQNQTLTIIGYLHIQTHIFVMLGSIVYQNTTFFRKHICHNIWNCLCIWLSHCKRKKNPHWPSSNFASLKLLMLFIHWLYVKGETLNMLLHYWATNNDYVDHFSRATNYCSFSYIVSFAYLLHQLQQ